MSQLSPSTRTLYDSYRCHDDLTSQCRSDLSRALFAAAVHGLPRRPSGGKGYSCARSLPLSRRGPLCHAHQVRFVRQVSGWITRVRLMFSLSFRPEAPSVWYTARGRPHAYRQHRQVSDDGKVNSRSQDAAAGVHRVERRGVGESAGAAYT